ncbi:MAG: PEGA domain-containing protein [Planctomycetota bacterium]
MQRSYRSHGSRVRPTRGLARAVAVALVGALVLTGCRGSRVLRVRSTPAGATVRLDDTVVGRTPIDIPFKDYGRRRLSLYRPGYRTHTQKLKLDPRWWKRFPLDIVSELLLPFGFDDVRELDIPLAPDSGTEAEPATDEFVDHALRARSGESLEDVPVIGSTPEDEQ